MRDRQYTKRVDPDQPRARSQRAFRSSFLPTPNSTKFAPYAFLKIPIASSPVQCVVPTR